MRLSDFKVLTFDCYGTLIDWETGLAQALAPLSARAGVCGDAILEAFAAAESRQQQETPGLRYNALLARVYLTLAKTWNVPATSDDATIFGNSVPDWPAFPDTEAALGYLSGHFALVVLSNIDLASFAGSAPRLGVTFDAVYTAEEIGSYKPDPWNFAYLTERLAARGFMKKDILHVAQSLYHDHVPAQAIGLATAWIDRRGHAAGSGATMPVEPPPRYDFRFATLAELADAHRGEAA